MWKKVENISNDDIKTEKLFWLSYNNTSFIGYFYDSYGGLNYNAVGNYESLPNEVKGNHMGSVKKLDGYCEIEIPPTFIEQQREEKLNQIL